MAAKDIRGGAVLKIDPATGSVLEATPLRGAAVDNQSQFRDVQWLAVGRMVRSRGVQGGTFFRLDPRTGRVTGRLNLPVHEPGGIAAGEGAYGSSSSTQTATSRSFESTLGRCA